MASIFISHSSADDVAAVRVRDWLVRAGFASIFLDFDPDSGIAAARKWEEELRSELRKADVVVFLATEASVNSKWCHAELVLAREFGRTILPVLLEPNARSALVADVQEVRWVPANGHVAEQRLVDALRKLTLDPRFALPWNGSKSPYPGLHPFEEDRAGVFYGRDPEIARVLQRLTGPRGDTSERFVVVVGASGSGKSSLVRAGVLPRLPAVRGDVGRRPANRPRPAGARPTRGRSRSCVRRRRRRGPLPRAGRGRRASGARPRAPGSAATAAASAGVS